MPKPITNNTTDTLIATITALNRALSRMPIARIAVMISAMQNAGRLKPISTPKTLGAPSIACARCASSGDPADIMEVTLFKKACVPGTSDGSEICAICRATIFSAVRSAVQWSYASHNGILR